MGRLKQKVYLAWESLYARQKKKDYFPVDSWARIPKGVREASAT